MHHIKKLSLILDTMGGGNRDGELTKELGLQQDTWLHTAQPLRRLSKPHQQRLCFCGFFNCINIHKQTSRAGGFRESNRGYLSLGWWLERRNQHIISTPEKAQRPTWRWDEMEKDIAAGEGHRAGRHGGARQQLAWVIGDLKTWTISMNSWTKAIQVPTRQDGALHIHSPVAKGNTSLEKGVKAG